MSKIALKSSSSGTATFTIESPSTNTDRTLNLPDSAGTVATAESTLAQFNASGSAPVFACRAFVNFQGTGTVAIRASGNVSSITDNGVGRYTVNFATVMPDANFSAVADGLLNTDDGAGSAQVVVRRTAFTTTSVGVRCVNSADIFNDPLVACVAIFR